MVSSRRRRRFRFAAAGVERLEERTLLTNYVVNTLADVVAADGKVGLREAVQAANDDAAVNEAAMGQGGGVVDQISFDPTLAGGTITLQGTAIQTTGQLRIVGLGADRLAVSGNDRSSVFRVLSGATVEIRALTITGGSGIDGGGIISTGNLTLAESAVVDNEAGNGGGILSRSGRLTVVGSTISGNFAFFNGGGINLGTGAVMSVIQNSTISGNQAGDPTPGGDGGDGGGIYVAPSGEGLEVRNTTVFGNRAARNDALGGGMFVRGGSFAVRMFNTLVAGNTSGTPGEPDDISLLDGSVTGNNNLIGSRTTAGNLRNGRDGNIVGVDWRAVLDPVLRDYGGPTRTHRLLPGSRAVDAGLTDASTPGPYDQRGVPFARSYGRQVDIGAYEAGPTDDLIGYLGGSWAVAASTGAAFVTSERARWSNAAWTALKQGDFDGDGLTDVLGLFAGEWYVGRSTGTGFVTGLWGKWQNVAWENVLVGDINNDGRDDILAEVGGQWYGATSTGTGFGTPALWAGTSDAAWDSAFLSDVTGEGREDLVLVLDGDWYVGVAIIGRFAGATRWARWGDAAYQLLTATDLDLDGRADAIGFAGGEWRVGLSGEGGGTFGNVLRAKWASATWLDPLVGDFDGDGRADVAARFGGQWYVGITGAAGAEASRALWATWGNVAWRDVRVGDFDGDGRDDIAGRFAGEWYVGRSTGSGFETTLWGSWAEGAWRAVAAADAAWAPPASAGAASTAAALRLAPAPRRAVNGPAAFAAKGEEPLARFWSRAEEDEEFGRRLLETV